MALHKINEREYMKRMSSMTLQERREYMSRVGEWLKKDRPLLARRSTDPMARLQSVMQLSAGWSEAEQQAFHTGARLLTALMGLTDTWLPEQLYMKSAKRSIYRMAECLVGVSVGAVPTGVIPAAKPQGTQPAAGTAGVRADLKSDRSGYKDLKSDRGIANANTQGGRIANPTEQRKQTANGNANKPANGQPQGQGTAQVTTPLHHRERLRVGEPSSGMGQGGGSALVPARPKHIDQYAHLLPKATQERAAKVGDLLRELDTARENARKLMEAGEQGDKIAAWAKRATTLDNTVGKIYRELDAEWEKLVEQGRVGVDAFGNAYVNPAAEPQGTEHADGAQEKPELSDEQKKRLKSLQSFLREKRIGKDREKHIQKWKEYYRELVRDFGTQYVTESACAIAETLGIELKEITTN